MYSFEDEEQETFVIKKEHEPKVEEWLKALRSGKYSQTQGLMYDPYKVGFCCLGVYKRVVEGCPLNELYTMTDIPNGGGEYKLLDVDKEKYSALGDILGRNLIDTLVGLNDNVGYDFKQIADFIEENVEYA